MNLKDWIKEATKELTDNSIPTARLDAEILLADELQKDRTWLHAHPEFTIQSTTLNSLYENIRRRTRHEPLAYIRGRQEFFGRNFKVSPDTLTPRPETETLVEFGLEILSREKIVSVADIGTGSGCIIITLLLSSNSSCRFTGYDISKAALKIARENAKNLHAQVTFAVDDLTKNTSHKWQSADLVVANLPYVPIDFHINLAATHEPDFAIFGGEDGLDYYRSLFSKLKYNTKYIITESMPPQHEELAVIARKAGYKFEKSQDFVQVFIKS